MKQLAVQWKVRMSWFFKAPWRGKRQKKCDRNLLRTLNIRTIQGSILGLVLFSLFVSPILEKTNIVAYADDTYTIRSARTKENAAAKLGKALTIITQWFKSSGLKVNKGKTEIAIFYKNNCNPCCNNFEGKVYSFLSYCNFN